LGHHIDERPVRAYLTHAVNVLVSAACPYCYQSGYSWWHGVKRIGRETCYIAGRWPALCYV